MTTDATGFENYYKKYTDYANQAGVTPISRDTFWQYTGGGNNLNGGYLQAANEALSQIKSQYNTLAKQVATQNGTSIQPWNGVTSINSHQDFENAIQQLNNIKTASTDTTVADNKAKAIADAKAAAAPTQDVIDIQKQIKDIIANPYTINPEDVKKWTDWQNENNKTLDAQQNTRLNEQFAALGDLGSSANRSALSGLAASNAADRGNKALTLATNDVNNKYTQVSNSLNALLGIANNQKNADLGVTAMNWQDYLTKQNQSFTTAQTNLQNQLAQQNNQQNFQQQVDFYNANKPAEQDWWQPILNKVVNKVVDTGVDAGLAAIF